MLPVVKMSPGFLSGPVVAPLTAGFSQGLKGAHVDAATLPLASVWMLEKE
jgi:hypothetical protein